MSILSWDKPKRARTPKEHAETFGAEDAPPGVYVPNMSDEDAEKWKAKVTGQKRGILQVEIRKRIRSTQLTLIVCSKGGYVHKWHGETDRHPTEGINIHLSINGPLQMTFHEMDEMQDAVAEARLALLNLEAER